MSESSESKKTESWTSALRQLTPATQRSLSTTATELAEGTSEFEEFAARLSGVAKKSVESMMPTGDIDEDEEIVVEAEEPKWFAIVSPNNGEQPFIEEFKDSSQLAGYLMELDCDEYYAFPCYGNIAKITEAPNRFMHTHDGDLFPLFEVAGGDVIVDPEDLVYQENYYLGLVDREFEFPEETQTDEDADADLAAELTGDSRVNS